MKCKFKLNETPSCIFVKDNNLDDVVAFIESYGHKSSIVRSEDNKTFVNVIQDFGKNLQSCTPAYCYKDYILASSEGIFVISINDFVQLFDIVEE